MKIRELKQTDKKELKEFFLGLSKEYIYHWNRFGDVRNEKVAERVANEQVNKPLKQEKGFVAVSDREKIMGYSFLSFFQEKKQKRYTTSLGIVVGDRLQGKGIGSALPAYMLKSAKKGKMKKIWLGVYSDNKGAIKLYQKFGFEIEGIFMYDEYFDNKPRHIVSMALFLGKNFKNIKSSREKLWKSIF